MKAIYITYQISTYVYNILVSRIFLVYHKLLFVPYITYNNITHHSWLYVINFELFIYKIKYLYWKQFKVPLCTYNKYLIFGTRSQLDRYKHIFRLWSQKGFTKKPPAEIESICLPRVRKRAAERHNIIMIYTNNYKNM